MTKHRHRLNRSRLSAIELLENRRLLSGVLPGDANLDGHVDAADYSLIDNGYAMGLHGWANGDFNSDGKIDGSDYSILDSGFNKTSSGSQGTIYRVGKGQALQTISAAVALAQPGDTVLIDPGTYHEQIILSRSGTDTRPIKFASDGVLPAVIDGTGFDSIWNGGDGAVVRSNIWTNCLVFSHCNNPLQSGAVYIGDNSVMNDCIVQYCDSGGIIVQGSGAKLLRDSAQYNGEEGIIGNSCTDVTATNCITRYNNNGVASPVWAGSASSKYVGGLWYTSLESGGGKWAQTDNVTLTGWQSYGNMGQGISFDVSNTNTTIRSCTIRDQSLYPGESSYDSPGLVYEISYGPCVIQNCNFSNNPGGGLVISTSSNVTISSNTFVNNSLTLTNWSRGNGFLGEWNETNLNISRNLFNNSLLIGGGGNLFAWDANTSATENIKIDYDLYINTGSILVQWGEKNLTSTSAVHLMNIEAHGVL